MALISLGFLFDDWHYWIFDDWHYWIYEFSPFFFIITRRSMGCWVGLFDPEDNLEGTSQGKSANSLLQWTHGISF
jgi:hypothetical protein